MIATRARPGCAEVQKFATESDPIWTAEDGLQIQVLASGLAAPIAMIVNR